MKTYRHLVLRDIAIIIAAVICSTLVLYAPFILKSSPPGLSLPSPDMHTIYKNYDGPLYIVPAKTMYNPKAIENLHLEVSLPSIYYAAHFPLYPALIRIFSVIGYLQSMIAVSVLGAIGMAVMFYLLVSRLKLSERPLILTLVFIMLPRLLVVRTVGAPESLFILFILASLLFFEKERYFWAGLMGGLATMTKAPGILLIVAYVAACSERYLRTRKADIRWGWLLLIPAALAGVFGIYALQYQDFFAFWHTGGVVPIVYPYSAFNFQKKWIGTGWLEDIALYLYMYIYSAVTLKDGKYRGLFYFAVVFTLAAASVEHRDIARYALPLWPLACIAFERAFTSKRFLIAFIIILPALFLYAWNFISFNTMPVSDWAPFI